MGRAAATRIEVPARVHLAGNPSDGYGGAVLSVPVPALTATVEAEPGRHFSVRGPDRSWATMEALVVHGERVTVTTAATAW